MAQVLVRKLDDQVAARLKRQAKRNGRSMEDEVRHILRAAVNEQPRAARAIGSRIAGRFKGIGLSTDLPELRQSLQPAEFDE